MNDIAMPHDTAAAAAQLQIDRQRAIAFLNLAHAVDHFALLIFPAIVIGLEVVFRRPYDEMIALSTGAFVAFGVFSIPAGWLADRWSRRNMMALFYFGCAASLAGAGLSPSPLWLAAAMSCIGMFAAIYHPVGMAMLIDVSKARPRTLAFNGVCGNLGVTLAAGVSTTLAAWFNWRIAFLAPAALCLAAAIAFLALVPDDRNRTGKRSGTASIVLSPRAAAALFGSYMVISLTGGLTFNTALIALPKLLDERMGDGVPLIVIGWLATGIFLCGGLAQLAVGRLLERTPPHLLFAAVATVQLIAVAWAGHATGAALVIALAVAIAAIYGQTTVGDIVIARYVADAWRGRVYAVRYFLSFISSGIAVQLIARLYSRGGFDLVLAAIALAAFLMLMGVYVMAGAVNGAEAAQRGAQPQPAE
jgi:predicted MFS family arabinose efflux permease